MDLPKIADSLYKNITEERVKRIEEIQREEGTFFDTVLHRGGLFPKQIEGVQFLAATYDLGLSCILGDEMGVGKTVQTISFLFRMREIGIKGPFLIAVPFAVISTWDAEFKKWTEKLKLPPFVIHIYHGS